MEQKADLEHISQLVKSIRFAMVTTMNAAGEHVSRPLTTQKFEMGTSRIFFLVPKDCRACDEIAANPHVNLAYADPHKNNYISVVGHATVAYDLALIESLWNPADQAWFPEGPQDKNIRVITVDIQRADYWEATGSKVTQLFSYAKALITGVPPNMGEHHQVNVGS